MSKQFLFFTIGLASILGSLYPVMLAAQNKASISYFGRSPRLINVMTTYRGARVHRPRYYYTIDLPNGIGKPLKKITINQRHRENPITIEESTWDKQTETMTIIFEPPVSPGTRFTVGLKAKRNPDHGGIYLFGVTAFPAGNNPRELYLGTGRLHFYGSGDGDFD